MKLAKRVIEEIDLDGFNPSGAKSYVKSKKLLELSLDRIILTTSKMLKSLELMSKKEKISNHGEVAIKSTKKIYDNILKIKEEIKGVNGLASLVVKGENKKLLNLIKEIRLAVNFLDRSSKKEIEKLTVKQITTYLEFLNKEFINWEDATRDLT